MNSFFLILGIIGAIAFFIIVIYSAAEMSYLVALILGIILLITLVISMVYKYKNDEDWPTIIIIIIMCIVFIIMDLNYKEQCIKCGNDYAKYKVCCPRCGSQESKQIKTKEEINIDSVDINCNEVNIHKNEKKNVCDEDTKQWTCKCGQVNTGNYCQNCGNEK